MRIKLCKICGQKFDAKPSNIFFCSPACRKIKRKQYYIEYYKTYYKRPKVKERRKKYLKEYSQTKTTQINKKRRLSYQKNPNKIRELNKEYRYKNKEKIAKRNKKWREYNNQYLKKKRREYYLVIRKRYKDDLTFALVCRLRVRLRAMLRNMINNKKIKLKEYNLVDLYKIAFYLKKVYNLNPKDLKNYEIHHKIPISYFIKSEKGKKDIRKAIQEAFAPENHKLVTIKEHKKIHYG